MSTITEPTSGTQDLATIQTVVQQKEAVIGPLKSFAINQNDNDLVFTVGDSPADDHLAVLSAHTADPPTKDGYTLVYTGQLVVSGAAAKVDAFRKN
jgi:hypothetical protein